MSRIQEELSGYRMMKQPSWSENQNILIPARLNGRKQRVHRWGLQKMELYIQPPNRPKERVLVTDVAPETKNYDLVDIIKIPLDRILAIRRTKKRIIIVVH